MNQVTTLKPCPICGGPARVVRDDSFVKIACGAMIGVCQMVVETIWFRDLSRAAAAWNTRNDGTEQHVLPYTIVGR